MPSNIISNTLKDTDHYSVCPAFSGYNTEVPGQWPLWDELMVNMPEFVMVEVENILNGPIREKPWLN